MQSTKFRLQEMTGQSGISTNKFQGKKKKKKGERGL